MSIYSKSPRFGALPAVTLYFLATGCFDVEKVSIPSEKRLLIDDFEDGDTTPSASEFAHWNCYAWPPDAPAPTCVATSPGFHGNHAESFTFDLVTPTDPSQGSGAGLGASPQIGTVDLSAWGNLVFAAKFVPSGSSSLETIVRVRLLCRTVQHFGPPPPEGYSLDYPIRVPRNWEPFTKPLAEFVQPKGQSLALDCITRVDAVVFDIALDDGESGTLTIDDVYLE